MPDIALVFVSGHDGATEGPSPSYLHLDTGPAIEADLIAAGYTVATSYFVDGSLAVDGHGGYLDLVEALKDMRDEWVPRGTRVVIVAHGHGGVWAHEAIREVLGLAVRALVDLDTTSSSWDLLGHADDEVHIGGDPREAYLIGELGWYDSEDVVFGNVVWALEVRSGEYAPLTSERYDDAWNVRSDGSSGLLTSYVSWTDHDEVRDPDGTTLADVMSWLRVRMGP